MDTFNLSTEQAASCRQVHPKDRDPNQHIGVWVPNPCCGGFDLHRESEDSYLRNTRMVKYCNYIIEITKIDCCLMWPSDL